MTEDSTAAPAGTTPGREEAARQSMLRDRTDEMELIISGLTTFALLNLPGWLMERYADAYVHQSVGTAVVSSIGLSIGIGLCYALGACFLAHLAIRAYWVGLVGLRTVFPRGIDWSRTFGIGPVVRTYYQARLPDLGTAMDRADRVASTLFSVISLIALSLAWVGLVMLVVLGTAGVVGSRYGLANAFVNWAALGMVLLMSGAPTLAWLLDSVLVRLSPRLAATAPVRAVVVAMVRLTWWVFPQRLILPVQLTLQSNTRPIGFVVATVFAVVAVLIGGNAVRERQVQFTWLPGEFMHLSGPDAMRGMSSAHYEDQRVAQDRFRPWPLIPSVQQDGPFLPLFLPYYPLRDNALAARECAGEAGPDCLRLIWGVSLDGRPVPLDEAIPTQRADLGLRGLTVFVPLQGVRPGRHLLEVTWNPNAVEGDAPVNDIVGAAKMAYTIPFLFAPRFEQGLDDATGATPVEVAGEAPPGADAFD